MKTNFYFVCASLILLLLGMVSANTCKRIEKPKPKYEYEGTGCWKCITTFHGDRLSAVTVYGVTEEEIGAFGKGLEIQAKALTGSEEVETICSEKFIEYK